MSIIRFVLVAVVVIVLSALLLGYLAGQRTRTVPQRADTSDTVARAREAGADIGGKTALAATKVQETVNEAALSAKIKAKMALDDLVKARDINVTTHGTAVTLSGIVESKAEHDRAMALAKETNGVTEVIDDLHAR
jgi:hyperosmotically inducible periplasmic protein